LYTDANAEFSILHTITQTGTWAVIILPCTPAKKGIVISPVRPRLSYDTI